MSGRPVVGVVCCNRRAGTEMSQSVINRYVDALMRYADVSALLIPAMPDLVSAPDVVARLDGVLLTGSPSNVAPARYGDMDAGDGPFDDLRDTMVLNLVEAVRARAMPLLGICRGFQELNVAFGGSLRRDTSADHAQLKHHAPADESFDAMFEHAHSVNLASGGMLARSFGRDSLTVNSVHYQGIGTLGAGLAIEATAPDGLVEAVSADQGRIVAVQWHPEWQTDRNTDSQRLFQMFGRIVRGETI